MTPLLHMYQDELVLNCMRNPHETEMAAYKLRIEYIDAARTFPTQKNSKRPIHLAQTFPMMLLFQRYHNFVKRHKSPESNPGRMLILAGFVFGVCEPDSRATAASQMSGGDWDDWSFRFCHHANGSFAALMKTYTDIATHGVPEVEVARLEQSKKPFA